MLFATPKDGAGGSAVGPWFFAKQSYPVQLLSRDSLAYHSPSTPLISGRAAHSPRQRSPARGPWGLFCKSRTSAWFSWRLLLPKNSLVLNDALRESRPPIIPKQATPSLRKERIRKLGQSQILKSFFFPRKHELAYRTLSSIGPRSTHRAPGSCALHFPRATPRSPRSHQKSLALHTS